jgi:hypothetical protein
MRRFRTFVGPRSSGKVRPTPDSEWTKQIVGDCPRSAFPKFLLSRPSRPTAGIRKSLHANASTERTAKWESTPGRASNSDQTISRRLQFFDGRGQEGLVNTRTGRGEQKVGVAGNVRNSRGSLLGVKQGDCFSLPEASGGTIWTATVGMYCKSGSCSYSQ